MYAVLKDKVFLLLEAADTWPISETQSIKVGNKVTLSEHFMLLLSRQ